MFKIDQPSPTNRISKQRILINVGNQTKVLEIKYTEINLYCAKNYSNCAEN